MLGWFNGLTDAVKTAIIAALLAALVAAGAGLIWFKLRLSAAEVTAASLKVEKAHLERDNATLKGNARELEAAVARCSDSARRAAEESAARIEEGKKALAKARAEAAKKAKRADAIMAAVPMGPDRCESALALYRQEREK